MSPEPAEGGAQAPIAVIVAARNEAERIGTTLEALRAALPYATLWVADDASNDGTSEIALARGAQVVSRRKPHGKGANVTAAAHAALDATDRGSEDGLVLLCDADLGSSGRALTPLLDAVRDGDCDLAVAAFRVRAGGGLGIAVGFARWAIERRSGYRAAAPISGQRAMRARTLAGLLPLADGFGLETGMTIDAVRAGLRIEEVELDLHHRTTGRTLGGFLHRGRQLRDIVRAYVSRR